MMFPVALKEFRDYVHSFYGKGAIYDLGCGIPDIESAIVKYVADLAVNTDNLNEAWGGGDSIDRERVRWILEKEMGFCEEMVANSKLFC